MTKLLDAVTADTTGDAKNFDGGVGYLRVSGSDFGGGTVTLQSSVGSPENWIAVGADATFTEAGQCRFALPACQIRAVLSGSTDPSAVTAEF